MDDQVGRDLEKGGKGTQDGLEGLDRTWGGYTGRVGTLAYAHGRIGTGKATDRGGRAKRSDRHEMQLRLEASFGRSSTMLLATA